MAVIQSDFREWTLDKIDEAFGLTQVFQMDLLDEWTAYTHEITDFERLYIHKLQSHFLLGGDDWNEVELENKFISPLIVFSEIANIRYSYFLERELSLQIGDYQLVGKVDGMIATGFRNPKKPYFCLNEYKRGTDPNGDPKGQVLIAMLVAQHLNDNKKPIFGCFIIGKLWQFMVLQGNQYAISQGYTCDNHDIFDIYRLLKGLDYQIKKLI